MTIETLAEVICNGAGEDPNDEAVWQLALVDATAQEGRLKWSQRYGDQTMS